MPEEVAVVVVIAIIFGTISSIVKYTAKMKYSNRTSGAESGVTTSELRALLREAVDEATLPLRAEIEELRDELRASRGLPPTVEPLLDDADAADAYVPAARRQRAAH